MKDPKVFIRLLNDENTIQSFFFSANLSFTFSGIICECWCIFETFAIPKIYKLCIYKAKKLLQFLTNETNFYSDYIPLARFMKAQRRMEIYWEFPLK